MEDNFDYRELFNEFEFLDEYIESLKDLSEENYLISWTLVYRDTNFAIFADHQGETRLINANYINKLFFTE